jgi:hypothetical protein
VGLQTTTTSGILDYSRFTIGTLNEGSLIETSGMNVTSSAGVTASTYIPRVGNVGCFNSGTSHTVSGTITASIDWNNNGSYSSSSEAVNLDGDPGALTNKTFKASQNDWNALVYTGASGGGGTISGTEAGPSSTPRLTALRFVPQWVQPHEMPAELARP